jgi:acyl-CoA hydrolase
MDVARLISDRSCDAATAIAALPRHGRIAVGANAAEPKMLVRALADAASTFDGLEVVQLLSFGSERLVAPEVRGHLRVNALFIGPSVRTAIAEGFADYTPAFLSEIPSMLRPGGALPIDAALVSASPPDRHGWCSLGVGVDVVRAAVDCAPLVIAELNPRMPRTQGAASIHVSQFHRIVPVDYALPTLTEEPSNEVLDRIGAHVAELVEDGCTLQAGIGSIPDAVMRRLNDRKDLGIHTELLSDGLQRLIECGAATGAHKELWPGKAVTSFLLGSEALYSWADDNPAIEMQPSDITNDPSVIARHKNFVAINSALSVDLTGQVNADSIGPRFYSGIGGQVDFIRGAARSSGGRPIIALPSTAKGGTMSRIVATLAAGAGVVTSRGDVRFVVTEYGRADLRGLSIRGRVAALIAIAHPQFRDGLEAEARLLGWT